MRLWYIGRSRSNAQAKYVPIDDKHELYTIHLFRALLRQTSYLPDPASRTFFHSLITSRFRQYHPRKIFAHAASGTRLAVVGSRQGKLLKTARKGLSLLQRANDGHPRQLGKVLALTYGRIGRYRHELLQPLLIQDVPTDQTTAQKIVHPASDGVPQLSRQLQALVVSHSKQKLSFQSVRPTLEPKVPELNAWGRPTPLRRVRNIKRRWYAETLDRIMPPLPEVEWKRLQGLASGKINFEGPILKRGQANQPGFKHEIVKGHVNGGNKYLSHPHRLTARYMRRLWTKVFLQCPLMTADEKKESGWRVVWGNVQAAKIITLQPGRLRQSPSMFGGVDDQGKILTHA